MHLHAALLPPAALADQLAALVASVEPPVEVPDQPEPAPVPDRPARRAVFGRHRAPRPEEEAAAIPPAPAPPAPQLDLVPADQLHLPLSAFGSVTSGEVARVCRAVTEIAADLPAPTVWVAGAAALEFPGDRSVWATLDGDVDGLRTIFGEIHRGVERLGFFLDRRTFRPWIPVGTINDATTAPYLEEVYAQLAAWRSEPWQVDVVSVMRRSLESPQPCSTELHAAALGGLATSPPGR